MHFRGFLTYFALIVLMALAFGAALMFGVQHLAEPFGERLFRTAHLPVHKPVFSPATVLLLSHYAGIAGFLMVLGEGLRGRSRPVRRHY